MSTDSYSIPTRSGQTVLTVSKSKFIGFTKRVQSRSEMKAFYNEVQKQHPKANHHCWAMITDSPRNSASYGYSDDGEPAGTAGKPIINVLQHSGLGQTGVIITRYFGGIKLGKGGLVKAYTEVAKLAIEATETHPFTETVVLNCHLPYPLENSFRTALKKLNIPLSEVDYGEELRVTIKVTKQETESFKEFIQQKFGNTVKLGRN